MNEQISNEKYIKCNVCKSENLENTHYCVKCGNNLTNVIEKTDIIYKICEILFIIMMVLYIINIPFDVLALLMMLTGGGSFVGKIVALLKVNIIPNILFIIVIVLNKYFTRLCLKNIKIERK